MAKKLVVIIVSGWLGLFLGGCKKSADPPVAGMETVDQSAGEAGEAGENSGSSVGQWASSGWNSAVSAGSQTVEGTGQWLSKLYHSARDAGTTSASSVTEWASEDWNARGDWEYRIVELSRSDVALVETTLNEAGRGRWECYHVDTAAETWTFFLKRSKRSYLSRVPLRDLANILPGLNRDGGE